MGHLSSRRARALAALVAVLPLAGCAPDAISDDDPGEQILTPSVSWRSSVSPEAFRARVAELMRAIGSLRAETSTPWTGKQDDVTGYLSELAGGGYTGGTAAEEAANAFLAAHGFPLFGIGAGEVRFGDPEAFEGGFSLRGEQHVLGVPVLGGGLVVTVSESDVAIVVRGVRGRVFPGMSGTDIEPRITRDEAIDVAVDASQGDLDGRPRLLILPLSDRGALAWEVRMAGGVGSDLGVSIYLVDAIEGTVLAVQPGALDVRPAGAAPGAPHAWGSAAPPEGTPVEISGLGPIGEPLEGTGLLTSGGEVVLVDTTTPFYDAATGTGAVSTHDAKGLPTRRLPGPVAASDDVTIDDADALAAHVYGRYVLDYYQEVHGRESWDGRGGSLVSAANFGPPAFCNAYFDSTMMVYGDRCEHGGVPQIVTFADIDTTGHEITHGVTATSSNLDYTGQSGALNESFSDYFGNVIGNRFKGVDTATIFEDGCHGYSEPTTSCLRNPDGSLSGRYMLNGATFADYLFLLDPPFLVEQVIRTDFGGVHFNSAIWNNALWSIRARLAQLDGMSGNESPRALLFDAAVYGALTRHLTPTSGFLDARSAVEQAAAEVGADAEVMRVIREGFDASLICTGCASPPATPAVSVAASASGETSPTVSGGLIAWLEITTFGVAGAPTYVRPGEQPVRVPGDPLAYSVAFAGEALVAIESNGAVVRYDLATGGRQVLDQLLGDDALIPLAGSAEGAAWVDLTDRTLNLVDPAGAVRSAPLPAELTDARLYSAGLPIASAGTGGGTVAFGTVSGDVVAWRPGADPSVVARLNGPVLGVAAHGDRVLAMVSDLAGTGGEAILVDAASGARTTLSRSALAFGAALSAEYAVWPEVPGTLDSPVAAGYAFPDTNLALHSFASGRTYTVLDQRGMQGFPALSGATLVWQDAVNGGDDISMGTLPPGL